MLAKNGTSFAEEFTVCKRGYNWRFDFVEEIGADGGKRITRWRIEKEVLS